jgi:hypothetical protein
VLITAKQFMDDMRIHLVESDETVEGLLEFIGLPCKELYATCEGRVIDIRKTFQENSISENANIIIHG